MAVDALKAAAFAAENYTGSLDTRALWQWAGGRPEDVVFDEPPLERWKKLWSLASGEGPVSRISLVRQMLFDRPGDGVLLGFLSDLRDELAGGWVEAARLLVLEIEAASPVFDEGDLWAALQSFPVLPSLIERPADAAFALLAPAVDSRLSPEERSALEARLDSAGNGPPPGPGPVKRSMQSLLRRVSDPASGPEQGRYRGPADSAAALARGFPDSRQAIRGGADGAGREAVRLQLKNFALELDRLLGLSAGDANPAVKASIDALFRQHGCLYAMADGDPPPPFSYLCDAMIQAIWATKPRGSDRTEG